jgi:hypothetical protein
MTRRLKRWVIVEHPTGMEARNPNGIAHETLPPDLLVLLIYNPSILNSDGATTMLIF